MSNKKYRENYGIFENEDPNAFYILGCYMSDGNLYKEGNSKKLSLYQKDKDWLIKIRDLIFPDSKVKKEKKQDLYRLTKRSMKIGKWMEEHGCVPNKSLVLEWPKNLPKESYRDFIRGYIDGDGSVIINNSKGTKWGSVSISSGSEAFIDLFIHEIKTFSFLFSKETRIKESSESELVKSGGIVYYAKMNNAETKHFIRWLYYSEDLICLERKREKGMEVLRIYANTRSKSEWEEIKKIAIKLRTYGLSIPLIAEELKASVGVIKKYVKKVQVTKTVTAQGIAKNSRKEEALKLYRQNLSIDQIAEKMGMSKGPIYSYLKGHRHIVNENEEKIKEIKKLREEGLSLALIHEKTGFSKSLIKYHIKGLKFSIGKRRKITKQDKLFLWDCFNRGMSNRQISEKTNISVSALKNHKKQWQNMKI